MPRPRKKKPGKTETLGDRIRRLRLAKSLTQTDLGKLVGVSQKVVTYYEVRGVSPPPDLIVKIANVLDVSTDVLLGRKGSPRQVSAPVADNLRRLRRLKRIEELPPHEQLAVLNMIDAMADRRAGKRNGQKKMMSG